MFTIAAIFAAAGPLGANVEEPFEITQEDLPTLVDLSVTLAAGVIHVFPAEFRLFLTMPDSKAMRYCEDIGLIKPLRSPNGHRAFRDTDMHKLAFPGRARALGFTIENCRALLALWEDKSRASADVLAIETDHLKEIEVKIADLTAMRDTLNQVVRTCAGNNRPDCPILTSLGGKERTDLTDDDFAHSCSNDQHLPCDSGAGASAYLYRYANRGDL